MSDESIDALRNQTIAAIDQDWAVLKEYFDTIFRISQAGPDPGDEDNDLVIAVFNLVARELLLRKADACSDEEPTP